MPCKVARLVSRIVLPFVFSTGMVDGCTSEIPNSGLMRGNGTAKGAPASEEPTGETPTTTTPPPIVLGGVTLGTTFKSSTELQVHVPGAQTSASGVYRIVVSAQAGALSNPMTFTVANPSSVAITQLVPSAATISDPGPITLVITGSGFAPTSQVRFNGVLLTTTFASATALEATMPMST